MNTKQIIVIRRDLKMRRGKEIAQGSHASMAFLTRRIQKSLEMGTGSYAPLKDVEKEWINSSFRKITCQVQTLEELEALADRAKEAGLETHIITDSGYTEFDGVPTITCLAIGPDESEKIDPVTKDLRLY